MTEREHAESGCPDYLQHNAANCPQNKPKPKMTYREAIKKAVAERNACMAGRIADRLRFQFGFNYNQIRDAFEKHGGCNAELFESLMYYADTMESGGRFERE